MKARIRRLGAWVLAVELVFTCIPNMMLFASAEDSTIYVSGSGSDSNSGSSEEPVATIEKALELSEDGDTIRIINKASSNQPSGDEPLRITKRVTICGGALTLSKAGIVLGTDATFDNVSLNFANPVRNAIIANGYTLTLNDVKSVGHIRFICLVVP